MFRVSVGLFSGPFWSVKESAFGTGEAKPAFYPILFTAPKLVRLRRFALYWLAFLCSVKLENKEPKQTKTYEN